MTNDFGTLEVHCFMLRRFEIIYIKTKSHQILCKSNDSVFSLGLVKGSFSPIVIAEQHDTLVQYQIDLKKVTRRNRLREISKRPMNMPLVLSLTFPVAKRLPYTMRIFAILCHRKFRELRSFRKRET